MAQPVQIEAIPTVYRGVQMRSRAEADMARLLDLLKLPWKYEATSVLLPNGMHYRPDFVLPNRFPGFPPTWIEVRGSTSRESYDQMWAVAHAVVDGYVDCCRFVIVCDPTFAVPAAALIGRRSIFFRAGVECEWRMSICTACKTPRVTVVGLDERCLLCGEYGRCDASVAIVDGYVSLFRPEEWPQPREIRVRNLVGEMDMDLLFRSLPHAEQPEGA